MIYTFKSKAAGNVIMTGPRGDEVLRVIGIEPTAEGIIEPAALPAALCAIEQAIAQQADTQEHCTNSDSSVVTLRQRTRPLVEMMRRAQSANDEVAWNGV